MDSLIYAVPVSLVINSRHKLLLLLCGSELDACAFIVSRGNNSTTLT